MGFLVFAGSLWLALSGIWYAVLRGTVERDANRLVAAGALGLATTLVIWLILSALIGGYTQEGLGASSTAGVQ
jgi:hypothetical protein